MQEEALLAARAKFTALHASSTAIESNRYSPTVEGVWDGAVEEDLVKDDGTGDAVLEGSK